MNVKLCPLQAVVFGYVAKVLAAGRICRPIKKHQGIVQIHAGCQGRGGDCQDELPGQKQNEHQALQNQMPPHLILSFHPILP